VRRQPGTRGEGEALQAQMRNVAGTEAACHPSGLVLVGAGYGLEQCGFAREPFISSNIYLGSDMLYFTYSPGEHA